MNKKILNWLESLMEEEALGLAPNPYQEAMKAKIAEQATAQAVQEAVKPTTPVVPGKIIFTDNLYTRDAVSKDLDNFYLFGDNTDDRLNTHYIPTQTQAVIRGLPNAIGIDTKHNRGWNVTSFLSDADFDSMQEHYNNQFKLIEDKLKEGHNVIIPRAGIGTGKAQLPSKAPRIFEDINNRISNLYNVYNKGKAPTDLGSQQMTSNEQLLSNLANSTELPLPKGKVISASYRTDIPAFYSSKLAEAIKKGSITIPTKFGMSNKTVSLKPEDVQVMELWTKNPKPMLNNGSLQTLKDYYGNKFYFQYSLNNYDKLLESNIPDDTIDTFKALSNELGKDRIIWRYDPIIMSEGNGPYTVQSHLDNYKNLAQILAPYTNHNVISFVDNYGKLKSTFAKLGLREPTIEEQKALAKGISEINKQYGLDISTCAEGLDLDEFGIRHGACTDPAIIEKLSGEKALLKELANRSNCGCAANTDIGAYNTCHNGCTYCYATNPSIPNIEHTATGFRDLQKYLNSKDLGEAQFKVISGGQTGIDILGVKLAKEYGLPTGGTIGMYPNGKYVIEADDAIDRSQFGFTTTDNTYYPYRTSQNVQNSDGTIYFKTDDDSRGYQATRREAMKYNKPFLENPASVDDAYKFITDNNIKTLNIAGNRGSKLPSELKLSTEELLRALFSKFKK